jgi:peroxiredoxin Q/BCP
MTGGCTKQACSYRDFKQEGGARNIEIVGISGDSPQNLKYFQQAHHLNFTLLSDPDGAIAQRYGVPVKHSKKSIQRTVDGQEVALERSSTAARWTFIVDPQGKVVYRDAKVAAARDSGNVATFLRRLEE